MKGILQTKTRGLTLIETLLYLALTTMIVAILGSFGVTVLENSAKAHALEEVHYNATFLIETIERTVREAEAIDVPASLATSTVLTLTMADEAEDPTSISVIDGTAYLSKGGGTNLPLTTSGVAVRDLLFSDVSYTSGRTLRIYVFFEAKNTENRSAYKSEEAFYTTLYLEHL